jgi:phage FluMu protein Com
MIEFDCTKCGKRYRVSDNYAGKRVRCKECRTINQIPSSREPENGGCGDSVAAFNLLLKELSLYEKTAPELDPSASAFPA